jgi:hypothetical protein
MLFADPSIWFRTGAIGARATRLNLTIGETGHRPISFATAYAVAEASLGGLSRSAREHLVESNQDELGWVWFAASASSDPSNEGLAYEAVLRCLVGAGQML